MSLIGRSQQILFAWWRHQMETFPRYRPFVCGIHRSPVNSPRKSQWRGSLMFSFICAWINGWVNNRNAGDLMRHCVLYDVIVIGNIDQTYLQHVGYLSRCYMRVGVSITIPWWRHQMETFSALLAIVVVRGFTGLRWIPRTKASDAELWCFLWCARLSKHSRGWWFETLSHPLWRHRNAKRRWFHTCFTRTRTMTLLIHSPKYMIDDIY